MPTFRCPAACTHCGTLSGPTEGTTLALAHVLAAIREASELGFYNVVFTGGEATLRWADLLIAIAEADRLGLPTRLVSNAHWATSPEVARLRIRQLRSAGLSEINYSSGDEHVRFVPIDRVAMAAVAAVEADLPVHVMIELRLERRVTREEFLAHPAIRSLDADHRSRVVVIESPWMPLDAGELGQYPHGLPADDSNLPSRMGCESVLQTYTVQADGRIGACCGLGLRLVEELNVARVDEPDPLRRAIERAEGDLLKLWIHYWGPERILAWAATKDPMIEWQGRYAHHCQACRRLYDDPRVARVIRDHYPEIVPEIVYTAWLEEEYYPSRVAEAAG